MNRGRLLGLVLASSLSMILAALIPATGLNAVMAFEVGEWQFNPATKHYYAQVDGLSWDEAEAYAVRLGGHLVTVNDQAEQDWLSATFRGDGLLIGFSDLASEGRWVWASGERVTYTNWAPGQPDNFRGEGPGGQDFAVLNWVNPDDGVLGWDDGGGSSALIEVRALPTTGWISGTVTAAGSVVHVDALAQVPDSGEWVNAGSATTDASGAYEIGGLPPADYRLVFRGGAKFADQYWEGQTHPDAADTVHVTAGVVVSGIDGAMVLTGRIAGLVADGTRPIANISVRAEAVTPGGWVPSASARSASDGTYALVGLVPGLYRISFEDPEGLFPPEVYDNASLGSPTLVEVAPGATTGGIDAALELPRPPVVALPGPSGLEPFIVVGTAGGIVGRGWPAGASVAVGVDDPATPGSLDLNLSAVADTDGGFSLEAGSDIVAGFVATAMDGTHLKALTVTDVRLTSVDAVKDAVQGTATPGSTVVVTVRTGEPVEPGRGATAGEDGTWMADFSVSAGTDPRGAIHDIVVGDRVSTRQSDEDGDMTEAGLIVPPTEAQAPADGFRAPGLLVPTVTTFIPTPGDISTDPPVVGANLLLAALAMILFTIATELLNRSLGMLDPTLRRRFRLVDQLDGARARLDAALIERAGRAGHGGRADALRILGIAAFYGIVFALLDPTWNPLSVTGLWLVLIMAVAFGIVGLSGDVAAWAAARRWGIAGDLAVKPGSLVAAVGSTLLSRVLVLVPGVMIGSPEALEVDAGRLDRRRLGGLAGVGLGTVVGVGLIAWVATLGTTALRGGGDDLDDLVGGAEAFLLLLFAAAVQNGFVQLLSLRESAGLALRRAYPIPWVIALMGVTFLFWHTLVNPRGDLAEALRATNVQAFLATVGIVLAIAVVVSATSWLVRQRAVRDEGAIGRRAVMTNETEAPATSSPCPLDSGVPETPVPGQIVPEAAEPGVVAPDTGAGAQPAGSTPPAADTSIAERTAEATATVPTGP